MSWGEDVNGDHWKGDHMDREILERMKTMVEESRYTVALCGSGMMEEVGLKGLKREDRAYEIEEKYGASPEELFNIACYSRHPERFFQFYREEILKQEMQISPAVYELAAMERLTRLLPPEAGATIREIWEEYEACQTPEARWVKALDKAETIIQHNQGANPAGFDYAFNLTYGSEYFDDGALLSDLRLLLDEETGRHVRR